MPAARQIDCSFLTLGSADAAGRLLAALPRPFGFAPSDSSSEPPADSSCSPSLSLAAAALRFCTCRTGSQQRQDKLTAKPAQLLPLLCHKHQSMLGEVVGCSQYTASETVEWCAGVCVLLPLLALLQQPSLCWASWLAALVHHSHLQGASCQLLASWPAALLQPQHPGRTAQSTDGVLSHLSPWSPATTILADEWVLSSASTSHWQWCSPNYPAAAAELLVITSHTQTITVPHGSGTRVHVVCRPEFKRCCWCSVHAWWRAHAT